MFNKLFLTTFLLIVSGHSEARESPKFDKMNLTCLAKNIYHEARGEGIDGMIAVGMVTLNRVKSKRYPDTICRVVYQGKKDEFGNLIKDKCQFSWACDGKDDTIKDWKTFGKIRNNIVKAILELREAGREFDITGGALHYHAGHVNPRWADADKLVAQIGDHLFYKGIE